MQPQDGITVLTGNVNKEDRIVIDRRPSSDYYESFTTSRFNLDFRTLYVQAGYEVSDPEINFWGNGYNGATVTEVSYVLTAKGQSTYYTIYTVNSGAYTYEIVLISHDGIPDTSAVVRETIIPWNFR